MSSTMRDIGSGAPVSTGAIFVGYRRRDTQGYAGRLADDLAERFGDEQIFRDDDIPEGTDFTKILADALGTCRTLLVVIGEDWVDTRDVAGNRRLDQPDDWVRLEIEAALARGVWVLPVLVSGAGMPRADELPPSLAPLSKIQAFSFSDRQWETDLERLADLLIERVPSLRRPPSHAMPSAPLDAVADRIRDALRPSPARPAAKRRWVVPIVKKAVTWGLVALVGYFVLENYAPAGVRNFVYGFFGFVGDLMRSAF